MPIINYLHTAIISGYFDRERWQLWADEIIMMCNEPVLWLFDISVAGSVGEACQAIAYLRNNEKFTKESYYYEPNVVIGYYYLLYKEKRINMRELYMKLSDEDDIASESELITSPEMKTLLNEMKNGKLNADRMEKLLYPLEQIARQQLDILVHWNG